MPHSFTRSPRLRPAALLVALVVALGIGVAPACSDDKSATSKGSAGAVAASASEPSWLLVLDAKNAETARTGDDYRVTLTGFGDVLAFTDRPIRRARRTTVEHIVAGWDRLFGADAPNAVLSGITPDGKSLDVAVELTQPIGDNKAVSFTVRGVGVDRDLRLPEHLVDVSLFIDDVDDPNEIVFASTYVPFDSSF